MLAALEVSALEDVDDYHGTVPPGSFTEMLSSRAAVCHRTIVRGDKLRLVISLMLVSGAAGSTPVPSPVPTPAPSIACNGSTYIYRLDMSDSGGDGWEGAKWCILDSDDYIHDCVDTNLSLIHI